MNADGTPLYRQAETFLRQLEFDQAAASIEQAVSQHGEGPWSLLLWSDIELARSNGLHSLQLVVSAMSDKIHSPHHMAQFGSAYRCARWQDETACDESVSKLCGALAPQQIESLVSGLADNQFPPAAISLLDCRPDKMQSDARRLALAAIATEMDAERQQLEIALAGSDDTQIYDAFADHLTEAGEHQVAQEVRYRCLVLRNWSMPERKRLRFQRDWFSHVIPILAEHVRPYRCLDGLNVLEIGSYEGLSTCWLISEIVKPAGGHIDCVEPDFKPVFNNNISAVDGHSCLLQYVGSSETELSKLLTDNYYLVYVDGDHREDAVWHDLTSTWMLLKDNGLMVIDDYGADGFPGIRKAADRFIAQFGDRVRVVHRSYLCILLKSPGSTKDS